MTCLVTAVASGAVLKAALEDPLEDPLEETQKETSKVVVDLVPEVRAAARGDSFDLLLRQKIAPGWHTYWRNPGDSGAPPELDWTLPPGVRLSEFEWPLPERIPFGPLVNFGYQDEVLLPLTVTLPPDFAGDALRLEVAGRILVCADICIPQQIYAETIVPVIVPVGQDRPLLNPDVQRLFRQARDRIPVRIDLPAEYSLDSTLHSNFLSPTDELDEQYIKVLIGLPFVREARLRRVTYFPFLQDLIDNAAEQAYKLTETGLVIHLKPGYLFDPTTADLSGLVVIEEAVIAEASADGDAGVTNNAGNLVSAFEISLDSQSTNDLTRVVADSTDMGLLLAVAFAFLGGLILNLMPCVFPILSIKILSLIETVRKQGSSMMLHGLTYSAGVLLSFIAIAALLIALRLSGEAIGWGYQLQSPLVVGFLAYLFVLVGLNLFGYFEIGGGWLSLGGAGQSSPGGSWRGYGASFATGILATLVAAPCTAPFMGAAIGFALLQSPPVSLLIFASLGAGMALPYLVLCASPTLLRWLPRPGAWMLSLRHLLAFPMFASAVWLLWVLGIQVGLDGMIQVLAGLLMMSFAIWLLTQPIASRFVGAGVKLLAVSLLLVSGYLVAVQEGNQEGRQEANQGTASRTADDDACLTYSPIALAAAREIGDLLVNFTAAWCITCKVNELTVLKTRRVREAMREYQVTCMQADWTNEDPAITAALQEYGRSGVPLYLLYRQGEERAEVLPQILTPELLINALKSP